MGARFRSAQDIRSDFQRFRSLPKWRTKSPWNDDYQCIAWAACYTDRHMWPNEAYWWFPEAHLFPIPEETPLEYFIEGFGKIGYEPCVNKSFELGYQKVAIYANDAGITHMARQHLFGRGWLSKLGCWEDILHERLEDVQGEMSPLALEYGQVVQVLKRSWWKALVTFGLFRCSWHALRFWVYRQLHSYET